MLHYVAGRAWQAIITIFILLTLIFSAIRFTGDPTLSLLPLEASEADRNDLRQSLHLDEPILIQFTAYLMDIASGDFGVSYKYHTPVTELLLDRLPVTLKLALMAGGLTIGLGLPLGILAARRRGAFADQAVLFMALIGQSVPIFVISLACILLFSVKLRILPVAGVDNPLGYVLPVVTLAWFGMAAVIRVTRVSMLNVLGAEYIVTARAKGLSTTTIIYIHALRNALIPIVTIFSLIFATLLTGTVVTETVFGLPGLGRLAVDAIINRDFPVVQGVVIFVTLMYILVNLCVDILYGLIDPRTRTGSW